MRSQNNYQGDITQLNHNAYLVKELAGFFFETRKQSNDECLHDRPQTFLQREIVRVVQNEEGRLNVIWLAVSRKIIEQAYSYSP